MTKRRQQGVTTVEFALIGASVMLVLFSVVEVGRAMFVVNTLGESSRRAARMAIVCPLNDPAIAQAALFNYPEGGASRILGGLSPENVVVEYLDEDGTPIADPVADYREITFVRTRIVNYRHQMLIPFATQIFTTPEFPTTLRRESLGVPREGVIEPC